MNEKARGPEAVPLANHPAVRPVVTARGLQALKAQLTHLQRDCDTRAQSGEISLAHHAGHLVMYQHAVEAIDQLIADSHRRAARLVEHLQASNGATE